MRVRLPVISFAAMAILAACGKPDPVADNANGAKLPAPVKDTAPSPLGTPPENDTRPANAASATPEGTIPAALQGRWGLTPADCTSTRGDAKGLLVISTAELRFYESRAVPKSVLKADADSISGDFDFTGEGQSWTRFETLERQKDRLVRTESNPAASYTYAKC
jgi:hypothetical protein